MGTVFKNGFFYHSKMAIFVENRGRVASKTYGTFAFWGVFLFWPEQPQDFFNQHQTSRSAPAQQQNVTGRKKNGAGFHPTKGFFYCFRFFGTPSISHAIDIDIANSILVDSNDMT